MRVKLKGIDFFKEGQRQKGIRKGKGLVLHLELDDGRSATQVIEWDAEIEVDTSVFPVLTVYAEAKK